MHTDWNLLENTFASMESMEEFTAKSMFFTEDEGFLTYHNMLGNSSSSTTFDVYYNSSDDNFHNSTTGFWGNMTSHGPRRSTLSGQVRIPLYCLIFLLAVVGNALVIVTLAQNRRMRTVTNVFLINLSISDLLLAVFCMPFTLIPTLLRNFIFGKVMCVLLRYLQGRLFFIYFVNFHWLLMPLFIVWVAIASDSYHV